MFFKRTRRKETEHVNRYPCFMFKYKVLCLEDYSLVEYKVYRLAVTETVCRLHFRAISRISQRWKQILPKRQKSFSYTVASAD
jgi:hypothetical protein